MAALRLGVGAGAVSLAWAADEPRALPVSSGDALSSQALASASTGNTTSTAAAAGQDQTDTFKSNPVTGLATVSEANFTPLTGSERCKLYFDTTYLSAGTYLAPVMTALLLDESSGTPRGWGGGLPGFGRRVVSRVGTTVIASTFQAPLAAALHEDVRYISSSRRSWQRRAVHAVLFSFLTYDNHGRTTPNLASIASVYASTGVSTLWIPSLRNAAKYTFSNATEQIVLTFPGNVAQEFWPEIRRHIFRQH
jgi:hypothetical protein